MPTERCGTCKKFMSSTEDVRCCTCRLPQHRLCVALPTKGKVPLTWRCPACVTVSDDSPRKTFSQDNTTKNLTIRDVMDEIRALRLDILDFRNEMTSLKVEVQTFYTRIEKLEGRMEKLEDAVSTQNQAQDVVENAIDQLHEELNVKEQELLGNDLEIRNMPEKTNENTSELIISVAEHLGINVNIHDIMYAERTGGLSNGLNSDKGVMEPRPRPIVVRLVHRSTRNEILSKARASRNINAGELGFHEKTNRIYVNERLTKANRVLLRLARDVARRIGWQFVWTSCGRVLCRRQPGEDVLRIRTKKDIDDNILSCVHTNQDNA